MKDLSKYRQNKPKFFSAPEYWFKKNKNLSVMNFKLEDQMGLSQDHFWSILVNVFSKNDAYLCSFFLIFWIKEFDKYFIFTFAES